MVETKSFNREVIMKTHTISVIRCVGMAGFVLAFGIFAFGVLASRSATAQSQNSVSFGHADFAHHADNQQPTATSNSELPVITPILRADMLVADAPVALDVVD